MIEHVSRAVSWFTLLTALSFAGGYGARAQTGMVASSEPLAIEAGERVLAEGGNAIEAGIRSVCYGTAAVNTSSLVPVMSRTVTTRRMSVQTG